jgi:A/G-specific adenine glycosylase
MSGAGARAAEIAQRIIEWYPDHARDLPWRCDGFPAWGQLIAEFMLQQTPVARVIPRLAEWLERWPTPADLASVPPGEAVRAWDHLGYPRRALALHATATAIVERHGGVVPADVDALLELPGIGPYTARAIAAFSYGIRTPVVDTNTRRVLARAVAGNGEAGPARAASDLAAMGSLLPADTQHAEIVNAGAMELGQMVCTARNPRCDDCPIADLCVWRAAGYPVYAGVRSRAQKPYAGSDRQARGTIMRELRRAQTPRAREALAALWPDQQAQFARALASLLHDGLVVLNDDGYSLP